MLLTFAVFVFNMATHSNETDKAMKKQFLKKDALISVVRINNTFTDESYESPLMTIGQAEKKGLLSTDGGTMSYSVRNESGETLDYDSDREAWYLSVMDQWEIDEENKFAQYNEEREAFLDAKWKEEESLRRQQEEEEASEEARKEEEYREEFFRNLEKERLNK